MIAIYLTCIFFIDTSIFSRSDPTENDSVEGLRPNARGPGLVTFGVSGVYFLCLLFLYLLF